MPERFRVVCTMKGAIQVLCFFYLFTRRAYLELFMTSAMTNSSNTSRIIAWDKYRGTHSWQYAHVDNSAVTAHTGVFRNNKSTCTWHIWQPYLDDQPVTAKNTGTTTVVISDWTVTVRYHVVIHRSYKLWFYFCFFSRLSVFILFRYVFSSVQRAEI